MARSEKFTVPFTVALPTSRNCLAPRLLAVTGANRVQTRLLLTKEAPVQALLWRVK
jgi:hypothetical protein